MHYSHKSFDSTLNPYMKNSIQNNPYEDQFHNYSNQKIYGESNEVIETQNYEQIESNPNNNNLQNDTNEHDNKQIENEVTRLPELSRNEQKQSRLQSSSNSGRHKNGNNSINLNSYELAKYFDWLKRRDPILSQIKIRKKIDYSKTLCSSSPHKIKKILVVKKI